MPTILRHAGFRFVIYPADHRPVHVMSSATEARLFSI
jgi:hypothetical protein